MTQGKKQLPGRMICALAMLFCTGLCAVLLLLRPWETPQESNDFSLHMIDVGQGDALLLVSDGKSMLVDGGPTDSSAALLAYLHAQKLTHLDYVVLTHAHSDHYGGLRQVFEEYDVGLFLLPDSTDTDAVYSFASWL
jgi:Predicted hydrolase (metallo-beta-lactamase superfamily)